MTKDDKVMWGGKDVQVFLLPEDRLGIGSVWIRLEVIVEPPPRTLTTRRIQHRVNQSAERKVVPVLSQVSVSDR